MSPIIDLSVFIVLTNPSQLIIRNSELLENKKVLLLNHECDLLAKDLLSKASDVTALALDYNHHLHLVEQSNKSLSCYFGYQLPNFAKFDVVVVYFPKSKSLAPYLFHLAAEYLNVGGELIVVGDNKGGVRSLPKLLSNHFDFTVKRDNARHSLLFTSELVSQPSKKELSDWCSTYQLQTAQGEVTICNLVGVFSEKKLDAGTALLLENLPTLAGRVLDFGCGAGIIAASLLKLNPSLELDCIDINAMALAACELTLKANMMNARIYPSDGLSQVTGKFNAIISNPPFHDGLNSTSEITLDFVLESKTHLVNRGLWQIVANRHLAYSDTITNAFGNVNVIAENNKYKVYRQVIS